MFNYFYFGVKNYINIIQKIEKYGNMENGEVYQYGDLFKSLDTNSKQQPIQYSVRYENGKYPNYIDQTK